MGTSNKVTTLNHTASGKAKPPRPVNVEQWPPELSAIAADMNGKPINVHRLMANNPALLNAWWTFRNHAVSGGALGTRKAELVGTVAQR